MDDDKIVDLYWARSEQAILETDEVNEIIDKNLCCAILFFRMLFYDFTGTLRIESHFLSLDVGDVTLRVIP